MMKFPSASAGGTSPSGNSFAFTYPGVFGSRAGGAGRARRVAGAAACGAAETATGCAPAISPRRNARVKDFLFMGLTDRYVRAFARVECWAAQLRANSRDER